MLKLFHMPDIVSHCVFVQYTSERCSIARPEMDNEFLQLDSGEAEHVQEHTCFASSNQSLKQVYVIDSASQTC